MADMSAFNRLDIASGIKDYSVFFIDDFTASVHDEYTRLNPHFIIDQTFSTLYTNSLLPILKLKRHLIIEATEEHKSLAYMETVINNLLNNGIKRGDTLIAIGGGIIQDITGFIATLLFRGIDWVFYPTTLLAQCDSCIGSKTSINIGAFKNQLGTFYPPQRIMLDANLLNTLSLSEIKSGMGEIIKVHLMDGVESLKNINFGYDDALKSDCAVLTQLIKKSLEIKKAIIEKDEFDKDYRNILNYGHTFGHAIESISNYAVSHGQAVTVGMDIANFISFKRGLLSKELFDQMRIPIRKNYPGFQIDRAQLDNLFIALSRDKKNVDQDLSMILTKGPGAMFKMKLPFDVSLRGNIIAYIGEM